MLTEITKYVPVPHKPIDTDESGIQAVVDALGTPFPDDFLEFGRIYGTGTLIIKSSTDESRRSYEIYSPSFANYPALVKDFSERQGAHRAATENMDLQLGLYPEPGGLLPFAYSSSGEYLTWKTVGEPNNWMVCQIATYDDSGYRLYARSFQAFLKGFITGQILLDGFQGFTWNPQKDLQFEPKVRAY